MSQQAGGRIVAVAFLASLVASSGLGLVGHALHSSLRPGVDSPSSFPRRMALRAGIDAQAEAAEGRAPSRPQPSLEVRPGRRAATGRHVPSWQQDRQARARVAEPIAGRVAVLIASPVEEAPTSSAAPSSPSRLPVEAFDAAPIRPTAGSMSAPTVSLVQYDGASDEGPAGRVVPLLEFGPATESRGVSSGERGPDSDSIECADYPCYRTGLACPPECW